jgi:hypothetical protein
MFETVYASTWHHPVLFWAVGGPILLLLARSLFRSREASPDARFLAIALVVFQLEILIDAWLTSRFTPLAAGSTAATAAVVTFVILGDLRYFVLIERFGRGAGWIWRAALWSLVVPVISTPVRFLWKGDVRVLFLSYELLFVALALVMRFGVLPRLVLSNHRRWLDALTVYLLAQYVLWASADVIILAGVDAGFGLRLAPNIMYYVGFVLFAWLTAPEELRP